jgi:hypothetical protein
VSNELEQQFSKGGALEASLRSIAFILAGAGGADERSFAVIKALQEARLAGRARSDSQLKKVLRDQSLLLRIDEKRAVDAIPELLPTSAEERAKLLRAIRRVVAAQVKSAVEAKRRLSRIEKLFKGEQAQLALKDNVDAGR